MSVANWKVIYRDFTSQELTEERASLLKESKNLYLAQSIGGKSYQRSITGVEERLRALAEIKREQAGASYNDPSFVDFSGIESDTANLNRNRIP